MDVGSREGFMFPHEEERLFLQNQLSGCDFPGGEGAPSFAGRRSELEWSAGWKFETAVC